MAEPIISENRVLLGSLFTISVYPHAQQAQTIAKTAINLAFYEIERIENLLTDFRDSPFEKINQQAGMRAVKVPQEIIDLLDLSFSISKDSEGAFDITFATIGRKIREAFQQGKTPNFSQIDDLMQYVDYRKIQIDYETNEVFLPYQEMKIGFGGIGKGYAVDKAYEILKGFGLENFFVNGAGDIRVNSSEDAPRPWRIALRDPFSDEKKAIGMIGLKRGACATSGDYERYYRAEKETYHHIIDARTGRSTSEVTSATILAPNATIADILATTSLILGLKKGIEFLNRRRHVTGFMVSHSGKTAFCNNWKHQLSL